VGQVGKKVALTFNKRLRVINTPSKEVISLMNSENDHADFFKVAELPDAGFQEYWDSIVIKPEVREGLSHYAKVLPLLKGVAPTRSGVNRAVAFFGPPGTGKTTLCRGLANIVALEFEKAYESKTRFFEINASAWLSELYGRTSKEISKGFEVIQFSVSHQPTIVMIDELEGITYARKKAMDSKEPSDAVRGVVTFVKELDCLTANPGILFLGTSNLPEAVDEAVFDRLDLAVFMGYPDKHRAVLILADTFEEYEKIGLKLNKQDAKAVRDALKNKTSGRQLRKLPLQAMVSLRKLPHELTSEDLVKTANQLNRRKKNVETQALFRF
jgi:AAA+ superfamily predicted ATPase